MVKSDGAKSKAGGVPTRLISWLSASVTPSAAVSSTRLGIVAQISVELFGQLLRLGVQPLVFLRQLGDSGDGRCLVGDRRGLRSRDLPLSGLPYLFGLLPGPANLLVEAHQVDEIEIDSSAPKRMHQPIQIGAENVRIYHEGRWYAGQPVGSLTMKVRVMALLVGSPSATLRLSATPS